MNHYLLMADADSRSFMEGELTDKLIQQTETLWDLWSRIYNCCQVKSIYTDIPAFQDTPYCYCHLHISWTNCPQSPSILWGSPS